MSEWLRGLPGRVADNALGNLVAAGVLALGALAIVFANDELTVPAWVAVVVALALLALAYVVARRRSSGDVDWLLDYLDTELALGRYYVAHVREVLEILQRGIAGDLPVTYGDFIQRGVLEPARDWLMQMPGEDIRISILTPDAAQQEFHMAFAAGHSLSSQQQFSLPIADSFAAPAFTRREIVVSDDVDNDPRFRPHPRARPGREYGSLVSVPITVGEDVRAVMNVISTRQNAFSPSDISYMALLGSALSVAWSLMEAGADPGNG